MELIDRIDEARERWDVLKHPFYIRWERGDLTRDELAHYAGEYRHTVVALARAAGSDDLNMPEPTNTDSAPNCMHSEASAGVAIPPAA